jgi:hypothetical protein
MQNVNFATETFSNQMAALLVNSFSMNFTHIVAFLQNTGLKLVEITSAYVNGLIATIVNLVKIVPNAVEAVILAGSFIAGNLHSVKLGTIFGTDVTFQASF